MGLWAKVHSTKYQVYPAKKLNPEADFKLFFNILRTDHKCLNNPPPPCTVNVGVGWCVWGRFCLKMRNSIKLGKGDNYIE